MRKSLNLRPIQSGQKEVSVFDQNHDEDHDYSLISRRVPLISLEGKSKKEVDRHLHQSRQTKSKVKIYFKTMENLEAYQQGCASTKNKIRHLVNYAEPKKEFDKKLVQLNIGKLSKDHKFVGLQPSLEQRMQMINSSAKKEENPDVSTSVIDARATTRHRYTEGRSCSPDDDGNFSQLLKDSRPSISGHASLNRPKTN